MGSTYGDWGGGGEGGLELVVVGLHGDWGIAVRVEGHGIYARRGLYQLERCLYYGSQGRLPTRCLSRPKRRQRVCTYQLLYTLKKILRHKLTALNKIPSTPFRHAPPFQQVFPSFLWSPSSALPFHPSSLSFFSLSLSPIKSTPKTSSLLLTSSVKNLGPAEFFL